MPVPPARQKINRGRGVDGAIVLDVPGDHNLVPILLPHPIADVALLLLARRPSRCAFRRFFTQFRRAGFAFGGGERRASGWARRHRGDDVVVERLHLIVVVVRGGDGLRLRLGGFDGFLHALALRGVLHLLAAAVGSGDGEGEGEGGGIERQRAVRRGREARWRDRRRGRRGGIRTCSLAFGSR